MLAISREERLLIRLERTQKERERETESNEARSYERLSREHDSLCLDALVERVTDDGEGSGFVLDKSQVHHKTNMSTTGEASNTPTHESIYMDFNATTPIDRRVRDLMIDWLGDDACGNPSSPYAIGKKAKRGIEIARRRLATSIGAKIDDGDTEIFFTSGATESSNWAIKGAAYCGVDDIDEIVTVSTEHVATLKTCLYLKTVGFKVTMVPVDQNGLVDLKAMEQALTCRTAVVSMMYANNETGTVQPVSTVADLIRKKAKHALFHCDASQAMGRLPIDVNTMGVDLLTIAGHKFHAPKGIGALYVRRGTRPLRPLLHGGGQECGHRPGTENTLFCVAIGKAAEIAHNERAAFEKRMLLLRRRLLDGLRHALGEDAFAVTVHSDVPTLCNTLHLSFRNGVTGSDLIRDFGDRLLASGQSACKTGNTLSHVLKAMGLPTDSIRGALRLSLGRTSTEQDIDRAVAIISTSALKLAGKCTAETGSTKGEDESKIKTSNAAVPLIKTEPLYYLDTHRTNDEGSGRTLSVVYVQDEMRSRMKINDSMTHIVTLSASIFHPQGGGQPSDVGSLRWKNTNVVFNVIKVVASPVSSEHSAGVVWHMGSFVKGTDRIDVASLIGQRPVQVVDKVHRLLCARLHSAGHLIDVGMHECGVKLKAGKGYHFPRGSYVEYVGKLEDEVKVALLKNLQKACTSLIQKDIPTMVHNVAPESAAKLCLDDDDVGSTAYTSGSTVRVVCVADKRGCLCGGTHVKSSKEIGSITITKIKNKKGNTRVSYKIGD